MGNTHGKINQLLTESSKSNIARDYNQLIKFNYQYIQSKSDTDKLALIKACAKFLKINMSNPDEIEYTVKDKYLPLGKDKIDVIEDISKKIKDDKQFPLRKYVEDNMSGEHVLRASLNDTLGLLIQEFEKIKNNSQINWDNFYQTLKNFNSILKEYEGPPLSDNDKESIAEIYDYVKVINKMNNPTENLNENELNSEWDFDYSEDDESDLINNIDEYEVTIENSTQILLNQLTTPEDEITVHHDLVAYIHDYANIFTVTPSESGDITLELKPEAVKYMGQRFTNKEEKLDSILDKLFDNAGKIIDDPKLSRLFFDATTISTASSRSSSDNNNDDESAPPSPRHR